MFLKNNICRSSTTGAGMNKLMSNCLVGKYQNNVNSLSIRFHHYLNTKCIVCVALPWWNQGSVYLHYIWPSKICYLCFSQSKDYGILRNCSERCWTLHIIWEAGQKIKTFSYVVSYWQSCVWNWYSAKLYQTFQPLCLCYSSVITLLTLHKK